MSYHPQPYHHVLKYIKITSWRIDEVFLLKVEKVVGCFRIQIFFEIYRATLRSIFIIYLYRQSSLLYYYIFHKTWDIFNFFDWLYTLWYGISIRREFIYTTVLKLVTRKLFDLILPISINMLVHIHTQWRRQPQHKKSMIKNMV